MFASAAVTCPETLAKSIEVPGGVLVDPCPAHRPSLVPLTLLPIQLCVHIPPQAAAAALAGSLLAGWQAPSARCGGPAGLWSRAAEFGVAGLSWGFSQVGCAGPIGLGLGAGRGGPPEAKYN